MKKTLLIILTLALFAGSIGKAFAQFQEEEKEKEPNNRKFDPKKLRFGGDLGLSFGRITYINLSPKVGYKLTDRFTPGIGIIYQYYKEKFTGYTYETTIYGGAVMGTYTLIKDLGKSIGMNFGGLVAHAEYNIINLDVFRNNGYGGYYYDKLWIGRFLIGGGISYKVSARSSFTMMVLWDLINHPDSPYQSPTIQLGFHL